MKDKFIEIYQKRIKREGADKLLHWLMGSDFFVAPASSRFHLSRKGGLCEHSINVYERLRELVLSEYQRDGISFPEEKEETLAICGLLHDICKVDFYKIEMRNKKDDSGNWIKVPYYSVEDKLPYGHGEKSVYIISGFMRLFREEAMAIRWHMGSFDDSVKGNSFIVGKAFELFSLALQLHIADLMASYLDEKDLS